MGSTAAITLAAAICCVVSIVAGKQSLPTLVQICDAKSPTLNECVKKSAEKLIPMLKKGVRDLDFPPLDPMNVPRMDIGQERGAVYLKLELNDTIHKGISDGKIVDVNMDIANNIWKLKLVVPRYELTGNYKGSGRILLLPLGGRGLANFTFNDLEIDVTISVSKKEVHGKNVYYVENAKTDIHFKPGKNFLNIERKEGDLTLAEHTRKFLGEHADEVFSGLEGTLEDTYSELFTQLIRKLFIKTPYTEIFKNA